MARRLGTRDAIWLSLIFGGLLLLAVQVHLGTHGFDHPHSALLGRILQAPGIALGWGGVALCVVGIAHAVVAWTRGRSPARILAALGTLVFGVGVGGVAGALASPAAAGGGKLGGGLGSMLADAMGSPIAVIILMLVSVPGILLALAPLILRTPEVRAEGEEEDAEGAPVVTGKRATPVRAKAWYPERRIAEDGTELPMQLPGHDVGPVRYRDVPPPPVETPTSTISLSPPDLGVAAPRKSKPITGIRFADEPAVEELQKPELPMVRENAASGIRYAAAPVSEDTPEGAEPAAAPAETADVPLPLGGVRFRRAPDDGDDIALASGVRFAGPPAAAEESLEAESTAEVDAEPTTEFEAPHENGAVEPPLAPPRAPVVAKKAFASAPKPVPPRARAPIVSEEVASPLPTGNGSERHRQKLAETGVLPGATDGTPRAGRPAKPKPRSSQPGAIHDAIRGLFSSLPMEELPPAATEEVAAGPAEPIPDVPGQTTLFEAAKGRGAASKPPPPTKEASSEDAAPQAHAGRKHVTPAKESAPAKEAAPVGKPAATNGAKTSKAKADKPKHEEPTPHVVTMPRKNGTSHAESHEEVAPTSRAEASDDAGAGSTFDRADPMYAAAVDAALERGSASLVLLKRKLGVGYARAASLMEALVGDGILGDMTASGSRPTLISPKEWTSRPRA